MDIGSEKGQVSFIELMSLVALVALAINPHKTLSLWGFYYDYILN